MKRQVFQIFFAITFLFLALITPVTQAQNSCDPNSCSELDQDKRTSCISEVIVKCEQQLENTRNQEKTLKSQLSLIDGQTKVTTLKIEETNLKIAKLEREIENLSTRIERISITLDTLSEILLKRIIQTYKYSNTVSTFDLLLSSHGFADLLERLKYIQVAQAYDKKKLYELQATKLAYNDQKIDKETRQIEAEKLIKDLAIYKNQLDQQKKDKDELLKITKNDEARYQSLLAQARAEQAIVFGGGKETFMRNVNQGDSIGSIASHGTSPGCSSGAHLHFEVHKNGGVSDPNNYLKGAGFSYSYNADMYGTYGTINPSGDLPWPINEPIIINQGYGSSHSYAKNSYPNGTHMGIDMDSGGSSIVKSVKSGKLYSGSYSCGNGPLYYAKVEHDDGLITWYLHMIPQ